jgi:hypothetical protein
MSSNVGNYINICNNDRVDELNERILARNVASGNMDMAVGFRPEATKYTLPNLSIKTPNNYNNFNNVPYDITKSFNPGNTMGPWSGFVAKVNDESVLRNQIHALQNCPQTQYIPNNNSDLYNVNIPNNPNNPEQLFPNLFAKPAFSNTEKHSPNKDNSNGNLGNNMFNNDTRQQLKDN